MDVSDYRRQYEEELEQAAEQQPGFQELAQEAQPAAQRDLTQSVIAAPQGDDDLAEAVAVVRDPDADAQLLSAALQVIGINIDGHPELIDTLLELLGDTTLPPDTRIAVLNLLQQLSFRMAVFPDKRTAYLAALRSVVDDRDATLRRRVIAILAREKDEYVQRRLLDGLEGRSRALVPAAKAIQFLGYDVHAEHFSLLRRIVEQPPSQAAKREAVRLLAADPAAADLLQSILTDKRERSDVRRISAAALQSLAPDEFRGQARRIILDEDEDDRLRAVLINALTYFADPAALSQDEELLRRVERLRAESRSRTLRQATVAYLAKYRV
jgi:hypothetical protein